MFFERENGDLLNLNYFYYIPAHIEGSSEDVPLVWVNGVIMSVSTKEAQDIRSMIDKSCY